MIIHKFILNSNQKTGLLFCFFFGKNRRMFTCPKTPRNKEEFYRAVTEKKNRRMETAYAQTPFAERVVLVPHCLRAAGRCAAKESGSYYTCAGCGLCKIASIDKKAKELGYRGVFILKGGRTVETLVRELKPAAVVGVACFFEGAQGFELTERSNIAVQFVSLAKDGCADTDVNLDEVFRTLEKKQR